MQFLKRPKTTLAIVIIAALLATLVLQDHGPPITRLEPTSVIAAILNDPLTPRFDPPDADVTLVVFTDYRCAVCKASNPAIQKVLKEDGRVRVLYKDWPILGEASRIAARAAIAAHRQDKYPQFHDALMRVSGPLDEEAIAAAAAQAGVDRRRLRADLTAHNEEIDATLNRNAFQAFSLGLTGTPGFLVGPALVRGRLDESRLERLVAAARNE